MIDNYVEIICGCWLFHQNIKYSNNLAQNSIVFLWFIEPSLYQ